MEQIAYFYLYEIVNLTKNKKYIGQHCTLNLNDNYFGSCKLLKEDIKNGDNVRKNILNFFNDIYDLGNAEYELIKLRNAVKDSSYYNQNNGRYFNRYFNSSRPEHGVKMKDKNTFGDTSGIKNGFFNKQHSKKSKNQISESKIGNSPAWNKGLKQKWVNNGREQRMIQDKDLNEYIIKGWPLGRGWR